MTFTEEYFSSFLFIANKDNRKILCSDWRKKKNWIEEMDAFWIDSYNN